jgi:hypothetical protein
MALGLTQSPTEINTTNFPEGKWRPVRNAHKLAAIYGPIV